MGRQFGYEVSCKERLVSRFKQLAGRFRRRSRSENKRDGRRTQPSAVEQARRRQILKCSANVDSRFCNGPRGH